MITFQRMIILCFIVEPGYDEDGKFGVHLENLVFVKKAETKVNNLNVNIF